VPLSSLFKTFELTGAFRVWGQVDVIGDYRTAWDAMRREQEGACASYALVGAARSGQHDLHAEIRDDDVAAAAVLGSMARGLARPRSARAGRLPGTAIGPVVSRKSSPRLWHEFAKIWTLEKQV
jgi:hypothetical protein